MYSQYGNEITKTQKVKDFAIHFRMSKLHTQNLKQTLVWSKDQDLSLTKQ